MPRSRANPARRKPKQLRAHDTVEVILDAAAQVLARLGYASATTNRIADEAGVSVGTVYEYFRNKDAVFDALIRREIQRLVAAFERQGIGGDAPLDVTILAFITAGMATMRNGPELYRALEAVPGSAFRRHLVGARQFVIDLIRRLLEAHRAELCVTDLDLAAFIAVSAVEGVAANATSRHFDARLADELTALLMRYLTDPAASPS